MVAIARQILEFKEREEGTKYLLDLLLQLFIRRNEFLKAHKVHLKKNQETQNFPAFFPNNKLLIFFSAIY